MSYIINNSRGNIVAIIPDGVVNTANTSLALIGQAVTNYGALQNENFVYLLENFASNVAPLTPILGQLWYNSDTGVLSAYNNANAWTSMASTDDVTVAITASKISPAFSGVPTAPTATSGTSNTQIATTAFVQNAFTNFSGNASLTGNSTAVTAAFGTNTTQIATTAFVQSALSGGGTGNTTVTGNLSATGSISGGNLLTTGQVSAVGNISGNYFLGNGSLLSGIITTVSNISNGLSNVTIPSTNANIGVNVNGVSNVAVFNTNGVSIANTVSANNVSANNVSANNVSYSGNIVSTGVGTPTVTSSTNLDLEAPVAVRVTGGGTFRLPTLTQTEINALAASAGDLVYNLTINKMQVYQYDTGASSLSWVTVTESRYQ